MITDEFFKSMMQDKDKFMEFMNSYKAVIIESVLCKLPDVVMSLTVQTKSMEENYRDFFINHPEFKDRKGEVRKVIMDLELVDPNQSLTKILLQVPSILNREIKLNPAEEIVDRTKTKEVFNGYV